MYVHSMKNPLVSVIVGVYNKERFVGECLRSVLAQTYPHFELIVVDDASTDGSLADIEKIHDHRLRLIKRTENSRHPGIPRNQGLELAQGDYIAFLDADDLWLPEKLETQLAYMHEHPEYPFTHTRCWVIDENGKELYLRHDGRYPPNGDCLLPLMRHCFICTSSVMMRAELQKRVGLFSEERCFNSGQDYEFFVRCAKSADIGMPETVLVKYRYFAGTVSRHSGNWRSTPADFMRHLLFLRRPALWKGRLSRNQMRDIAHAAAEENARYWRVRHGFAHAAWFARQMIKLRPFSASGWRQGVAALFRCS